MLPTPKQTCTPNRARRITAGLFLLAGLALLFAMGSAQAEPASSVDAGVAHNCALLTTGNIDCWGYNSAGQANDYTGSDATAVAAGEDHTCALLTTGNIDCWGSNGDGRSKDYTGGDATAVAVGGSYTCALLTTGNIDCWGYNSAGQANDYTGSDATAVAAGGFHTCALLTTGNIDCWGSNENGQADDFDVATTAPPTNLTAVFGPGIQTITLEWDAPAGTVRGYNIYRSSHSGAETYLTSVASNTTTYVDSDLALATTYYYRVSATNYAGESALSNEASPYSISGETPGSSSSSPVEDIPSLGSGSEAQSSGDRSTGTLADITTPGAVPPAQTCFAVVCVQPTPLPDEVAEKRFGVVVQWHVQPAVDPRVGEGEPIDPVAVGPVEVCPNDRPCEAPASPVVGAEWSLSVRTWILSEERGLTLPP